MAAKATDSLKSAIKEHLDKMAQRDGYFGQIYRKPNKNLNECINYIMHEAQKLGNACCIKDEDVFGMAVHYYEEDSIKDIEPIRGGVSVSSSPRRKAELTEEERKKIKEEAVREYKEQLKKELSEEKPANSSVSSVEEVKVPSMFNF